MFLFAAESGSLSLFSPFENNLLNWFALLAFLAWLWMKYMPAVFASRQEEITLALAEAARAKAEGEAFLEEQKKRVASAEQESDGILAEALELAGQMRQQMEAQTEKEMAELKQRIEQEIAAERQMAISQMRTAAAKAAIRLTESALPRTITDDVRSGLLDQFLDELEAASR